MKDICINVYEAIHIADEDKLRDWQLWHVENVLPLCYSDAKHSAQFPGNPIEVWGQNGLLLGHARTKCGCYPPRLTALARLEVT